jgi:hypothetical protein
MTTSKNTIELGYTLTDCYSANANFNGQQKQYVVRINGDLQNVIIGGYVNGPSDSDRKCTFHKIADITEETYAELKDAADNYRASLINWNKGTYMVYSRNLTSKEFNEIQKAHNAYIQTLMDICEPKNREAEKAVKKALVKVFKQYFPADELKGCEQFIYSF